MIRYPIEVVNVIQRDTSAWSNNINDFAERIDGRQGALTEQSETETIMGTVQPLKENVTNLPSGLTWDRTIRIYSSDELSIGESGESTYYVIWKGERYRLWLREDWRSGIRPHFKYYAGKF
jgi:hypothetical protein